MAIIGVGADRQTHTCTNRELPAGGHYTVTGISLGISRTPELALSEHICQITNQPCQGSSQHLLGWKLLMIWWIFCSFIFGCLHCSTVIDMEWNWHLIVPSTKSARTNKEPCQQKQERELAVPGQVPQPTCFWTIQVPV